MRIALVGTGRRPIPPTGYGGIERTVAELGNALRSEGQTVDIVNQYLPDRYTTGWAFERHLPGLLTGSHPDIVHVHTGRAGWVLGRNRIPYVYTTHTPSWTRRLRLHQSLLFERERQAVRWSDATIATTEDVLHAVEKVHRRRGPVVQIPLGVDTEKFKAKGPGEPDRVLGVGVVEPRKRWELAARAIEGTSLRLTIVGPLRDERYAHKLRELGADLTGEVPERRLLEEYERAYLLLHPSEHETTGMVGAVAQAMAFSRPALGGPALRGLTPFAAPSNEPEAVVRYLHENVERLIRSPEMVRRVGMESRERIERDFSWRTIAKRHLELYRSVVLGRRRS